MAGYVSDETLKGAEDLQTKGKIRRIYDDFAAAMPMPEPVQQQAPDIGASFDALLKPFRDAVDQEKAQAQQAMAQTGDAFGGMLESFKQQLGGGMSPESGNPDTYRVGAPSQPAGDGEIEQYIRQAALKRGIDPDIAVAVANSEGGVTEPARRGTFQTGSSWWPFQLHYGGAGYESLGDTAGMGNDFTARTGIAPGDPNGWRQSVDYALDQAKAGGWGPWYGAKAIGVTGMQGIGQPGSAAMLADNAPEASGNTSPSGTIKGMPVADALRLGGQFQLGGPDAIDQSSNSGDELYSGESGTIPPGEPGTDIGTGVPQSFGYTPTGSAEGSSPTGRGAPVRDNAWASGDLSQLGGPYDGSGDGYQSAGMEANPGAANADTWGSGSGGGVSLSGDSGAVPTRDDWRTNAGITPQPAPPWQDTAEQPDWSASPPSGAQADPGAGAPPPAPVEQPQTPIDRFVGGLKDLITSLLPGGDQNTAPEAPQRSATPENFNLGAAESRAQNAASVLPDASLAGMQAANAGFEQARQAPISFADTMREQTDTETQRGNELTRKWIDGTATPEEMDELGKIIQTEGSNVAGNGIEIKGAPAARAARGTVPEMASGVVSGADNAPQYDRYYHGTGGDFARPDPGKFDPNGLVGPGYYITDESRVAGGIVAKGGEPPMKPDPYDLARGGGYPAPPRPGDVLEEGYAQSGRGVGPDYAGSNVRPVDVPRDLNLLDADRQMNPAEVRKFAKKMADATGSRYFAELATTPNDEMSWLSRNYAGMIDEWRQTEPMDLAQANKALSSIGYDGIRYKGGQRVPMKDASGADIEHNVLAIFPESLDKIRNATAGTPGGFVPRTPPSRGSGAAVDEAMVKLGVNAAQGGVAGAVGEAQNDPNATPQTIGKAALMGATQRVLLGNARGVLGPGGARNIANAVRTAGRAATQIPIEMTDEQEIARLKIDKLVPPGTPDEIKQVITDAARNASWYHDARRGVRPDQMVDAEAAAINEARSVDDWIRGSREGRTYNDAEVAALRNAYMSQATVVDGLEKQLKDTPFTFAQDAEKQALQSQYLLEMKKLQGLGAIADGGGKAEAGRSFRQWGRLSQILKADPLAGARKVVDDLYGSSENAKEAMDNFMAMKAQGATPQELAGYLRNLGSLNPLERWGNRLQIYRYANMLWGTVTHLTNLGTTLGKQLGDTVVIKPIAVGMDMARNALDRAYTTEPYVGRQIFMGEIPPQLHAIGAGLINGLREVPEILRTGVTKEEATRLDRVNQGFGAHIPGVGEKSVPWFGDVNELVNFGAEAPLRALQAEDAFTKSGARAGHVAELATRQALQEGLTGAAVGKRAMEIISDPGKNWRLFDKAEEMTLHDAFQEKRALSDALLNMRGIKGLPGMFAQALMPFVKTPTNIAAQGLDMTPLGLKTAYDAAHAGGPHAIADAEMAASRAVFGSGIMGLSFYAGANGLMTTDYPEGPERTTLPNGWKPWSFKIPMPDGNTAYVSYSNMGPIGFPLAIGALMAHGAASGEDVTKWAPEAAIKVGKYTADMSFLQGISQFAQVLSGGADARAENFVEGMATQWAPAASMGRQIQQALGMASRDPHGAWEALMATYPGTANQVPAKQDSLGRDRLPTQTGLGAVAVPVRYGVSQPEPVLDAFKRAGVAVSAPPKEMASNGQTVKLTREQQAQFQRIMGRELQMHVLDLNDPDPTTREKTAQRILSQARDVARRELLSAMP